MHNERANSEPDHQFRYPGVDVRSTIHILEAAKAVLGQARFTGYTGGEGFAFSRIGYSL